MLPSAGNTSAIISARSNMQQIIAPRGGQNLWNMCAVTTTGARIQHCSGARKATLTKKTENVTLSGIMNKITPSRETQCAKPTLTPSGVPGPVQSVKVKIQAASGDYLCYTLDATTPTSGSSPNGTLVKANSVDVPVPCVFGRTLKAIACKRGLSDSPVAEGKYGY